MPVTTGEVQLRAGAERIEQDLSPIHVMGVVTGILDPGTVRINRVGIVGFHAWAGPFAGSQGEDGFSGMLQAQQEHALQIARGTALTTLASFLLTSAGLALVGARLPSDPDANAHGPATGRSDAP